MFLKPGGRHHPVGSFAGCVEGRGGGLGVPGDDGGSRQGYGVRLPLLPQLQRHHPGGGLLDPLASSRVRSRSRRRRAGGSSRLSTGISSRSAPASSAPDRGEVTAQRGAHAERVGDDQTLEPEVVAQEVVDLRRLARPASPAASARTSRWAIITAGAPASTAASNGPRSRPRSSRQRRRPGRQRLVAVGGHRRRAPGSAWSSTPCRRRRIPRRRPRPRVTPSAGRRDGDRDPIVGSAAPIVTSATGAKTHVKPRLAQLQRGGTGRLRPTLLARLALRRQPHRHLANGGNSVAMPRRCETTPPSSSSTPMTAGQSRPSAACARVTAAVVARTCPRLGHVGRGDAHAGEVVLADEIRGLLRGGAVVAADDDLTGQLRRLPAGGSRRCAAGSASTSPPSGTARAPAPPRPAPPPRPHSW